MEKQCTEQFTHNGYSDPTDVGPHDRASHPPRNLLNEPMMPQVDIRRTQHLRNLQSRSANPRECALGRLVSWNNIPKSKPTGIKRRGVAIVKSRISSQDDLVGQYSSFDALCNLQHDSLNSPTPSYNFSQILPQSQTLASRKSAAIGEFTSSEFL